MLNNKGYHYVIINYYTHFVINEIPLVTAIHTHNTTQQRHDPNIFHNYSLIIRWLIQK